MTVTKIKLPKKPLVAVVTAVLAAAQDPMTRTSVFLTVHPSFAQKGAKLLDRIARHPCGKPECLCDAPFTDDAGMRLSLARILRADEPASIIPALAKLECATDQAIARLLLLPKCGVCYEARTKAIHARRDAAKKKHATVQC